MHSADPSRILVTAGATHEPLDSVRYLGNKSSGKLGILLAHFGTLLGHEVTLLHGTHCISPAKHPRLSTIPFTSTRDLSAKVHELWPSHSVLIMAAAVADFTPKGGQAAGKIRREKARTVSLIPTEDIIAGIAPTARNDQRSVAFCLEEPSHLATVAKEKLARKEVDAIVANPLETMESDFITAIVYCKDGREFEPPANLSKAQFASWFISHLNEILF
jgi:phosphopantothenoylcysteine decarboxylase/phosphopantothenate--cysteine ligase